MNYSGPVLIVKDIEKSKKFYQQVLGCKINLDFGEKVNFENGFSLLLEKSWKNDLNINTSEIKHHSFNSEICFEENDYQKFLVRLETFPDIHYVHGVIEYPSSQQVIRFFDPDGHVVEVGEPMKKVIKRLLSFGMSIEETERRTLYPKEIIEQYLKELEEE